MRKRLRTLLERGLLLTLTLCVFSLSKLNAQADFVIGTGTSGNTTTSYPCPLQDRYEGSRAQYLYLASELTAAGMSAGNISAIKFTVTSLGTTGVVEGYTIKIGGTTVASLSSSSWETGVTTVYGPVDYQPVVGVNTLTFTTPYLWNGTDNLLVEICNESPNASSSSTWTNNPVVTWTTGLSFNASHTYRVDGNNTVCSTTSTTNTGTQTTRPNTIFSWVSNVACSGTPDAGTTQSSKSVVCMGEEFSLSLAGVTQASGLNYQWQSSPDNVTWSDISGATSFSLTTTQSASAWYRAVVTCTNGGASANSTSVQVMSPALVQGAFTINKAQPTGGTNFNSFNDAYNYIKCGINGAVVFNVVAGSGPYDEQLIMDAVPGASGTNTITFNGNGEKISFLSTNTNERAVIKLNGTDHVTFDNLVIEATGSTSSEYGFGVHLINNADSNTIRNCAINITTASTSTNYAGIVVSSSASSATSTGAAECDYNTFSNNTITGGYYGITLVGNSSVANGNNQVINNTIKDFYSYGIYLNGSFNTLVADNSISRPTRTTVTTFNGIYFTGLSAKANVTRNRITNAFGGAPTSTSQFNGIYFTSVDAIATLENVVSNNLITNGGGQGDVYGLYNSGSDNVWYYHNTIVLDGEATGTDNTDVTRGFYQTTTAAGIELKNNIIAITRGGDNAKTAIHLNTAASSLLSDRNDLYIASTTGAINIGYRTTAHATLSDWTTATTLDSNSVTTNPVFTDPVAGNYEPSNAAINNLGRPVGITDDINKAARSATTPDVGAWEFTPSGCASPPTPGTATVNNTPVCQGTDVALSVTGNSVGLGQTYQWQMSATEGGTYANIGNVLTNPDTVLTVTATMYYRVAVTCSGQTTYSTPVLVTSNPPLPAGTYTINKGAAASATNFVSFTAVRDALSCGIAGAVVFDVVAGSGPYNEQFVLDSVRGTSSVNTITFNGNGNTIQYSSSTSAERAVIKLRGADHVIFDNLVIDATGSGTYGWGVQLIDNADSNVFRNNVINTSLTSTSSNYSGIVISGSATSATGTGSMADGNQILNNTINGGYHGVTLLGTSSEAAGNNVIAGNTIRDFYNSGIYINGTFNSLVEGNDLSRPNRTSTSTVYGIYVTSLSVKLHISKNRVHNMLDGTPTTTSTFYGIYFTGVDAVAGSENMVTNNLIYNIAGNGDQYGLYNSGSDLVRYYHNTVSLDDKLSTHTTSYDTRGIHQTGTAAGLEFKNNLISITRSGAGPRHGIYMAASATEYVSNFNNFYVKGSNPATTFIGYSGTGHATLAAWRTATTQDSASLATNPYFSSLATGNLVPMSPVLDNKGTPVGITTDIDNAVRSTTTPDVGAYEFAVPPCTTPPTAGTAMADPATSVCMGTPVLLSLEGNSVGSGQTYQWQVASSATGPWADMGGVMMFPDTTIEAAATTQYYRVAVTCSGNTDLSAPVMVSINPAFLAGVYTIDPAQASSATNFQSFTAAVAALECGITGAVTFNVAAGTYTEQIRMHKITGASNTARVTFQSASGDPASVTLTYDATASASNYVLKLDSASYVTYKNMTIAATNTTNSRVIELANTASYDSLLNLVVTTPATTSTADTKAAIYADDLKGGNHVIRDNKVTGGSIGINIEGTSTSNATADNVIEGNTVSGTYDYGIYVYYNKRIKVANNTVTLTAPLSSSVDGIYVAYSDSAYQVTGNRVEVYNTTGAVYAIHIRYSDASNQQRGLVANNKVVAVNNNTGNIYGLSNYYTTYSNTVNNVVNIATSGASSYALYSYQDKETNYYNNSIHSASTSATNNHAGYFYHTSGVVFAYNNIFAHTGGGKAIYTYNPDYTYFDYNLLYTTGATLAQVGTPAATYADLQAWKGAYGNDPNSMVYAPAFDVTADLQPKVDEPGVWAIHGRGVQIEGNNADINNNPRATTLTTGVPDLGAYEFVPTSVPPVLTATPDVPAAGTTQTFMFGTDTVSKITWGTSVPATIQMRRYSGVLPPGLTGTPPHMYFYTDVETTGTGPFKFTKKDFFIDPWQGFIQHQYQIRMGRTDAAGTWSVGTTGSVDSLNNVITDTSLTELFQFTGMADINAAPPPPPVIVQQVDSSNMGKFFWVGYANSYDFSGNDQEMVLYLSTGDQPATVTVKVNGTGWVKTYSIPANTVITSDKMPKFGISDSRLLAEGKYNRGISIESDVNIVAYAHIYSFLNSGATMLLPVGTYGYEYYSLNFRQNYTASNSHSSFFVVADRDNTVVEITPSNPTTGGQAANVPFTVTLNRGEVYQVLGAYISGSNGYDLTGSKIKSIPNGDGKCYPIAVFAGSSRTRIGCNNTIGTGGDILFQQVFPSQAWGTRYLTAPTSNAATPSSLQTNIYRVMVKDTTTTVSVNGVALPKTSLINNRYYHFENNTANYIQADKPIMVAQYMGSSNSTCAGSSSWLDGDPEMFYLSPLEQAIKSTGFYRNNKYAIKVNYLTLIIPTTGLASLTIDGANTFDHTYAHPNLAGYTVVVKKWGDATGQSLVKSDSAFTGIVYGEGDQESYGYNVGTLVKNLNGTPSITNTLNTTGTSNEFTCARAPFRFSMMIPVKPTSLTWKLSEVPGLSPNADVVQANPVPRDSMVINNRMYYKFTLTQDYVMNTTGTFNVSILYTHPSIEGCNSAMETILTLKVVPAPFTDFTIANVQCTGDVAQLSGTGGAGVTVSQWAWTFADGSTASTQNVTRSFDSAGTFNVKLRLVTPEGCVGDTTKAIVVNARPDLTMVKDTVVVCPGQNANFSVKTPEAGVTYNWYTAATGGTLIHMGATYTVNNVSGTTDYYVEAISSGCSSLDRKRVTARALPVLTAPVAVVDSAGGDMLRFRWNEVVGATGYEVSVDGGAWIVPSSGVTGLTHTITGLQPLTSRTLIVRANGGCQDVQSAAVTGKTLIDEVFIPNSFSPNGDGLNDVLQVYGYVIKDMQFMVFNQWGQKIYESRSQARAWDGTHQGKMQPAGVYMYVCKMTLNDGTVIQKKGSINLIR